MNKQHYKLLVIEDNEGDFILLETYLQETFKSIKLERAKTFKQAKQFIENPYMEFDVVLLDLSLPDKSCQQIIEEILDLCPAIPVIVLTGYGDLNFGATSLSLGISDYILKDELSSPLLYKSIIYSIERRKALAALQDSLEAIANQNKRLRQISWIQSHRVRGPVAKILGLVDLIEENDSPFGEIISRLKQSALELDQVIRSIHQKSGITEGQML